MAERTDAEHYGQLLFTAYLEESPQVALSVPAEDALLLLDVVPEDAALLHLVNLLLPLVGGDSRVVDLAHDRTDTPSVNHQAESVPRHRLPEVSSRNVQYCQQR